MKPYATYVVVFKNISNIVQWVTRARIFVSFHIALPCEEPFAIFLLIIQKIYQILAIVRLTCGSSGQWDLHFCI